MCGFKNEAREREALALFSWFSKETKQTFSLSQTPPAGAPSVLVPTGLSAHSHQIQLRLHEKKRKKNWEQRPNAFYREGNNNILLSIRNNTINTTTTTADQSILLMMHVCINIIKAANPPKPIV